MAYLQNNEASNAEGGFQNLPGPAGRPAGVPPRFCAAEKRRAANAHGAKSPPGTALRKRPDSAHADPGFSEIRRNGLTLAGSRAPVGMIVRGRRPVPAGLIVFRAVVMRRRDGASGQSKTYAEKRDKTKTNHDNSFCFHLAVHVRLKVAVAFSPPSGLFSSVTSPPCMRAMLRAMDRPSPVPPVLRLRERSTL